MIIKVFQINKDGKIEFTKKELETLLNEVYWDGYKANSAWTWTTPSSYPIHATTNSTTNTTTAITVGDKT